MQHMFLVDDDMNFRRSLMIQLELENYTVTQMESAIDALKFLENHTLEEERPDAVITDVKMDGMSGEEFVAYLRSDYPEMPVLVISAYDLPPSLKGYPFLRKPFSLIDMKKLLDDANPYLSGLS